MSERIPPLHPWSLGHLLGRIEKEFLQDGALFSLPARRFFKDADAANLHERIGGRTIATPVGPAAGPHTQLAQNIVLAWLAGGRSFELKTVQVLDELDIGRPCIDMRQVGFNTEWSQELTLPESLHEYRKTALLLEVLRRWDPLREVLGESGEHIFELSVGYDLAGVQSESMTRLIAGLCRSRQGVDALRDQIGGGFASLRDVPVPERLVSTATISTFHGCPPAQVEGIVKHLMTAHGLDVTVKLNPTLLGPQAVAEILHDRLGYHSISLAPEAFTEDLQFDGALELIGRLQEFAAAEGREFGIKLTNTLVVANDKGVLPGTQMYMSGAPLHVLAVTLLDRLAAALPGVLRLGDGDGPVPVAFSAGIDKKNLTDAVALGLRPVTICSDLLKPGGYGRMAAGLRQLGKAVAAAGGSLGALRRQAATEAEAAGHRDAAARLAARLATPEGAQPYTEAAVNKPLRQVENTLQRFECVACNNCVTVCPNNAFWAVPSAGVADLEARNQYLVLAELCNDCGNCTPFCPEIGQPHMIKPRLYTRAEAWERNGREGFLVDTEDPAAWQGEDEPDLEVLRGLLKGRADRIVSDQSS